jgi:hypothetical protein
MVSVLPSCMVASQALTHFRERGWHDSAAFGA